MTGCHSADYDGCMISLTVPRPFKAVLVIALLVAIEAPTATRAEPPTVDAAQSAKGLVAQLDADDFFARETASRRLRALALSNEAGPALSEHLRQLAVDPQTSYEVRLRLREVLQDVSRADAVPTPETVGAAEAEQLLSQLGDSKFSIRESASFHLRRLLENPTNIVPLMVPLNARLADADLQPATRQDLEQYYIQARKAWLLAPADCCAFPDVSDEQLAAWINAVVQPDADDRSQFMRRTATRELQDLLVRDDCRPRVTPLLEKQLANTDDPRIGARVRALLDFVKPAMVAEIWSASQRVALGGGVFIGTQESLKLRLATTQYLHVGVPQIPEGAPKATFFDHVDDQKAHCVSGNTLLPGDYPIGIAVPHPEGDVIIFHLVNLPNPRRRLIYEYSAERSETVRLAELTERTCASYVAKERVLTAADVLPLVLLDRGVVSQFAGKFFAAIDDSPLAQSNGRLMVGHTSTHGAVCYALALVGTKDAAVGIQKAVTDKRILPSTDSSPYELPTIALLAIAHRDPWQNVDAWLGAAIEQDQPLVTNVEPAPDMAATAAAILFERYQTPLSNFGLIPQAESFCNQAGLNVYRFGSEEDRQRVIKWWKAKQAELARDKAS
jgi:hypothetical protein